MVRASMSSDTTTKTPASSGVAAVVLIAFLYVLLSTAHCSLLSVYFMVLTFGLVWLSLLAVDAVCGVHPCVGAVCHYDLFDRFNV